MRIITSMSSADRPDKQTGSINNQTVNFSMWMNQTLAGTILERIQQPSTRFKIVQFSISMQQIWIYRIVLKKNWNIRTEILS